MVRRLDSVNDFARQGLNLRITCGGCTRTIEANATLMMIELMTRKVPWSIRRVERCMRCRVCGHRGAEITPCEINF